MDEKDPARGIRDGFTCLVQTRYCQKSENEKSTLVWSPCSTIDDKGLVEYLNEAKEKNEHTEEQSLGLLFYNRYNLEQSREDVKKHVPLPDIWSKQDKEMFEEGFKIYGKNFSMIHRRLPDKSMKRIIEYYYSWKRTKHFISLLDEGEKMLALEADEREKERHGSSFTQSESTPRNLARSKTNLPFGMFWSLPALNTVMNDEKGATLHSIDPEIISLKTEGEEQINDSWSNDEYFLAVEGIRKYGKNFKAIAEVIQTKTEEDVKIFYLNFRQLFQLDNMLQEHHITHFTALKR
ncbi:REST corepressor 2 [Trichonephila clavata]|uniref:REST corepressor 2 n=1 Tax=Trichonephila clavata TaxID=2740835 RepID=A0A8X6I1L6_TRICU|nr:REST corepressor 2 [Trichonephila clavata]